jgi:hypothetical protein
VAVVSAKRKERREGRGETKQTPKKDEKRQREGEE